MSSSTASSTLAGAGQGFDGNGPYLRLQPGGGPVLVHNPNPTGTPGDQVNFTNTIEAPDGIQPVLPSAAPPFRMDVACAKNRPPNLNGPASAAGPAGPHGCPDATRDQRTPA